MKDNNECVQGVIWLLVSELVLLLLAPTGSQEVVWGLKDGENVFRGHQARLLLIVFFCADAWLPRDCLLGVYIAHAPWTLHMKIGVVLKRGKRALISKGGFRRE